jgi:hypothetical protein
MMFKNNGVWVLLSYITWYYDNFHYCSTVSKIHTSSPHNEPLSRGLNPDVELVILQPCVQ